MNRMLWFRVLQVAVVAPWLYYISGKKGTPRYYRTGFKMVAGTVVVLNIPPLYEAYKTYAPAMQTAMAQMKEQMQASAEGANVIEGEAVEVNA